MCPRDKNSLSNITQRCQKRSDSAKQRDPELQHNTLQVLYVHIKASKYTIQNMGELIWAGMIKLQKGKLCVEGITAQSI